MTTKQSEQLRGNEATLVNSARAQLKSFRDKLHTIVGDADQALITMDAQLQDWDADPEHPRSEMTTTERKEAEEERAASRH
jgi:hypothetical protein